MDSEDSRPGSSASSSSSNSSNNSRPSSPELETKNNEGPQSPPGSPQLSLDRKSRSRSRSSNGNSAERRSESKSNSVSSGSSSSSDNENDDDDATSQPKSKRSSARSSSEEGSIKDEERQTSRPQSPSPVDSQRSLRHSSSSSNRSQSNSRTEPDADAAEAEVNISHEDLSDVSDMESEKRVFSNNNSKQYSDDAGVDENKVTTQGGEPSIGDVTVEHQEDTTPITDLRQKLDKKKEIKTSENGKDTSASNGGYSTPENCNSNSASQQQIDDLVKTHDEDALDFEAEEGECLEVNKEDEKDVLEKNEVNEKSEKEEKSDGEAEDGEELEEGEVSDEEEKRPEETEPKPVCRFYTRGQCTWGMSCRFLHPGVTDKGNYTMFDLVRPVPVSHSAATPARPAGFSGDYHDFRTERPQLHHRPAPSHFPSSSIYPPHHDARSIIPEAPVVVESAWERGLRTAKEMMRKASKRKEQDMDFEDKKMNLPISPEELEKDAYYLKERASPPETVPPFSRHGAYHEVHSGIYSPPERFGRAPPIPPYDDLDPYGRSARYRELPPHRMPQYEDERRVRPTREVIVQRVEPAGRGDEWSDPWMRSKSPGARGGSHDRVDRRRRDRRSYSSNSSYSTSTSSQSDSSSESSGSPSPADHRRRYNNAQKSPPPVRRHGLHSARSPSLPIRRGRRSPAALIDQKSDYRELRLNAFKEHDLHTTGGPRRSPLVKRRAGYSTPSPTLDKRLPYSPAHKRKRLSPTPKKSHDRLKPKRRHTSSSSGSDSSDSSASDSDSDSASSSSDSSSRSRGKTSRHAVRNVPGKASVDKKIQRKLEPPKKRSPISIEIKKPSIVGASALTSPTLSASSEKETKKSRREELLKQLRAVEDAIAKKRQKLA